ncbi:beta-L-arabinofuranosidase domain-containing protein [Streptomyces sp. NPDC020192]|uniref:beta-L-arabinofuranosidase domain-containing protein n=1 Tax=Streptomyces sp. NPDC020192 TaxID=3365066 RepID=UPI0037AA7AC9
MTPPLGRRSFLGAAGATAAALTVTDAVAAQAAPHGTGARRRLATQVQPFPLTAVTLLAGPFQDNQHRNSAYLRFVDIDRLLHTFRRNVGLPSSAQPCGGWEAPTVELRGHSTGHLLSGLALAYANTGDTALRDKGRSLVAALAACQAASPKAGYGKGYLSAFPENFFDRLEAGTGVWAPYYTIHKIMAGLVEQYRLAGNAQALDVVLQLGQWVNTRTSKLSYAQMQQVLETEFGGMNDVLSDLHAITGDTVWLDVAQRFTHARVFDPLAAGQDQLAGLHANTQIPKMVGALRMWQEGLADRYRTIAQNFWQIVTDHHSYVIGGNSNGEAFHGPDAIAAQLSNGTCENCNSYNMLKLTRLLHFGGVGWYRKHFRLPAPADAGARHVELCLDGVHQNADVWLNGVHLGFHPYGYTSFAHELTPHLAADGRNVLAVRVDDSGQNSRWYSGSGIYRHTWLTVTGPVRIPLWGVRVTTPEVGTDRSVAHLDVSVTNLGSAPGSATVRVTVLDPHGRTVADGRAPAGVLASGVTAVAPLDLTVARPSLWSPESPSLYTARAEVLVGGRVVDTVTTAVGFRSLAWNRTSGFKEAGFNAIRTAHNPPTPSLLDACDRLGMLVMDEFFDVWDTGKNPQDYSVHFADWWERDLTGTVLRDRNHPSVVIWSLGNEITDKTNGVRGAELARALRALDSTRPITLGGGSTFSADDPSWSYVDVGDVHYNANGKGYGPMHDAHPERAMTQSEGFPATIYQDTAFVNEHAWAVGSWVWAAWDYLGESGIGKTPMAPEGTAAGIGDPSKWRSGGATSTS